MQVITPIAFTTSQLFSTTATETYSAYASGTTYTIGARVTYGTRIYESVVGSNIGNQPDISPSKWANIAPMNKYAMFDTSTSTQTTAGTSLTTVVRPGAYYDSLAVLNLTGSSLNVLIKDTPGGTTILNNTYSLIDNDVVIDWYTYFFSPFTVLDTVTILDIPPYSTSEITLTITSSSAVAIGECLYGPIFNIGTTQYGMTLGVRDYSIKETDSFGTVSLIKRDFSRRLNANLDVPNSELNFIYKKLNDIRTTPTVWIPTKFSGYESAVIYGYYKDYNISIQYPEHSVISLDIEGLT